MKTTVYVTQSDIDKGQPQRVGWCPIALALKRKFKTGSVEVCNDFTIKGKHYRFSNKVNDFISDFDSGEEVKPFKFTITT